MEIVSQECYQSALILREWGFSVFSLDSLKKPLASWKRWQNQRPTDTAITEMFARRDRVGGLAVVTGRASGEIGCGLVVRDFDQAEAYHEWATRHPELAAKCPTVKTFRGYHVYLRVKGPELYQRCEDGEILGDSRHYAVLPPSRHPAGIRYQWLNYPTSINDFPIASWNETGFLMGSPGVEKISSIAERRIDLMPRNEERISPVKVSTRQIRSKNGLCPTSTPDEVNSLPTDLREAVLRTLPKRAGQRNEKLFSLARSIRSYLAADTKFIELFPIVRAWWTLALPVIQTKGFEETWYDFQNAWSNVTVPMSESFPLLVARRAAESGATSEEKLWAICQTLASPYDRPFYLSARLAGTLAGISKSAAGRTLRNFVQHGILEVIRPGCRSPLKRIATYYRLRKWGKECSTESNLVKPDLRDVPELGYSAEGKGKE